METINTIQEIVNKKARLRAESEVQKLRNAIHANNHILDLLANHYVDLGNGKKESIRELFWSTGGGILKELIRDLTKIYIPIVSNEFVQDVERLKQDMDDVFLRNNS